MAKRRKAAKPNATTAKELTLAVVSDLHAYDNHDGPVRPSFFCTKEHREVNGRDPVAHLYELINREHLTADILLCPGDLGDKANPVGIETAWKCIAKIGDLLGVNLVAGTAGNHDVDSRHEHSKYDAKGFLQTLEPPFPFRDETHNDRYWSRHFEILTDNNYRLLVLNSSAFHGQAPAKDEKPEYEHGRVSDYTIEAVKRHLGDTDNRRYLVNVLLCHHHPQEHSELQSNYEDYEVMKGGQVLLEHVLGSGKHGNWLVIHGHKHHPKITYAQGSAISPVVFSAGSLASTPYPELGTLTLNQFYTITLPYGVYNTFGFVGTFRSWNWHEGIGWKRAEGNLGLPASGGFGCRDAIVQLASEVDGVIGPERGDWMEWKSFLVQCPKVRYLLPADFRLLQTALKRLHIEVSYDDELQPKQIGRAR